MHADLLTVLNDDRMNEKKIQFKYPEHEIDDSTKSISVIKKKTDAKVNDGKTSDEEDKNKNQEELLEEDNTVKKTNVVIWILSGIFVLTVLVVLSVVLVIPALTKVPDIKIPDVSNSSVIDAEATLKKAGFEVALETKKEENEKVDKGNVIKTSPRAGRSVKKGSTITIYESLGKETYVIEDYTGENYIQIETRLKEVYGLEVTIEKKDVDNVNDYKEENIIGQSIEKGTTVAKGDKITLYIPNIIEDGYPNMVEDGWAVADVEAFCEKYNITLKIDYQTTTDYSEGTLISQSRSPKTPIVSGSNLKIVVAQAPNDNVSPAPSPTATPSSSTEE